MTVYLALALSNRDESQEFHVLLILIILIITIFFCHALIRLCMMILHPPDEDDLERQNLPSMIGPGGYANPSTPIRVALARDEEAAGMESEATKLPPPAYGLWRESVVCEADRLVLDNMLTLNREWTPTGYSGHVTMQHRRAKLLVAEVRSGQPQPTGHLRTSRRMASNM